MRKIKNKLLEILRRSVVKRNVLAEHYETEGSRISYEAYRAAYYGEATHYAYDYTEDDFAVAGIPFMATYDEIDTLGKDNIDKLVGAARDRILGSYVETNRYYRTVMGLPPLKGDNIDPDFVHLIDGTPIHEMGDTKLYNMYESGELDKIYKAKPWAEYIRYLHRRVDLIKVRDARPYELVKLGGEDPTLLDKFNLCYTRTRNVFMRQFHNTFYEGSGYFYEPIVILMLVYSAVLDLVDEAANNPFIDYEDPDDVIAILNEFDVPEFNVPFSMKSELARNLRYLVHIGGSRVALLELSKIFNTNTVCRLVMHRMNLGDDTVIKFHKVPLDVYNPREIVRYEWLGLDDVLEDDPYIQDKEKLKEKLLGTQFSLWESKYITIEDAVTVNRISFEMSLLFGYIIAKKGYTELKNMRHADAHVTMSLVDLLVYMCILQARLFDRSDDLPDNAREIEMVVSDPADLWIGLNNFDDAVWAGIKEEFTFEFSGTEWAGLLDKWNFADPKNPLEFIDVFYNNKDILDRLMVIMNSTYDMTRWRMCRTVYDRCTMMQGKKEVFGDYTTYGEYLQDNNSDLWERIETLTTEKDMRDEISLCLDMLRDLVESVGDTYIDAFGFISGSRDFNDTNFKDTIKKVILYFSSHNIQFKNSPMKFYFEAEGVGFKVREEVSFIYSVKEYIPYQVEDSIDLGYVEDLGTDKMKLKEDLILEGGFEI